MQNTQTTTMALKTITVNVFISMYFVYYFIQSIPFCYRSKSISMSPLSEIINHDRQPNYLLSTKRN